MSSTYSIARSQIIYGLCLPLAALVGYMMADPEDPLSMTSLFVVGAVLAVPILMRWYHPITVFSWNTVFCLAFLPGAMPLWFFCACASFVIILLNRSLDTSRPVMVESSVAWSLVILFVVVALTAHFTGGIGARSLGSETYGGKKYFYIIGAILGYYVIAGRRIPLTSARWYVAVFFLTGLTGFLGDLVYMAGPAFYPLYYILPTGSATYMAFDENSINDDGLVRIAGLTATEAGCIYLLARYGVRGLLDFSRPWRMGLLLLFLVAGLYSGFRSFLIGIVLIFAVAFFLEGLYRTRYMVIGIVVSGLLGAFLVTSASRLPLSVQRAICFLPVDVNPEVKQEAQASVDWRVEMWETLLPDVYAHFWKGKGYRLDPGEMTLADENVSRGNGIGAESSMVAGDYHNGPLSILIPFGIWGMLAFAWFLFAMCRMLIRNCVHGDPALLTINRALLACFVGKTLVFIFIFGSISTDLAWFTGTAGLAVSLNGESVSRLRSRLVRAPMEFGGAVRRAARAV